ncbi:hypothetical protein GJ496_007387 [Pomphorhynchus laevis]|nr:hypothetical protein GJ496_007387 [Pomphorhynchus laevis]
MQSKEQSRIEEINTFSELHDYYLKEVTKKLYSENLKPRLTYNARLADALSEQFVKLFNRLDGSQARIVINILRAYRKLVVDKQYSLILSCASSLYRQEIRRQNDVYMCPSKLHSLIGLDLCIIPNSIENMWDNHISNTLNLSRFYDDSKLRTNLDSELAFLKRIHKLKPIEFYNHI